MKNSILKKVEAVTGIFFISDEYSAWVVNFF